MAFVLPKQMLGGAPRLNITPELLMNISSVDGIKALKLYRVRHMCRGCGMYCCRPCRNLKKAMCRAYHIFEEKSMDKKKMAVAAQDEIAMRLVYEYLFDMIHIEDISTGAWKEFKGDDGHVFRIKKLLKYAKLQPSEYDWLEF